MRRGLVLVLGLLLLAGCGVRPSEVIPAGPAPKQHATVRSTLYWLSEGKLVGYPRLTAEALSPEAAVEALLEGPTPAELDFDLRTALPVGEVIVEVSVTGDGPLEVRLDTGVAGWSESAVDQVVCTAATAHEQDLPAAVGDAGHDLPVIVGGDDVALDARSCPLL